MGSYGVIAISSLLALVGFTSGCSSPSTGSRATVQAIPKWDLPGGARAEFVGVIDNARGTSWKADGTPISDWIGPEIMRPSKDSVPHKTPFGQKYTVVLRLNIPRSNEAPSVGFVFGNESIPQSSFVAFESLYWNDTKEGDPDLWLAGAPVPAGLFGKTSFRVGVAIEPWNTLGAYVRQEKRFVHSEGSDFRPLIVSESVEGSEPSVSVHVEIPKSFARHAVRVVAFDSKGEPMPGAGSITRDKDSFPSEFWFRGRYEDVARVELQHRRYEWNRYGDVSLKPKT